MKIGIIGTGYVGLVTGVCLASKGHFVKCFDRDPNIISTLKKGKSPIFEEGLDQLLEESMSKKRIEFDLISPKSLSEFETIIIAVGTPFLNGRIDLSQIESAATIIGQALKLTNNFMSVIVKSTVVPGTTDTFVYQRIQKISGKGVEDFGVGMNPEFLREGKAVEDFMNPDRIVMGFEDKNTLSKLEELYSSWGCDKLKVNCRTAEMIKYANNVMLATQISAVNEIANISSKSGGIDIMKVIRGVQLDDRWNPIAPDGNRVNPSILTYLIPGCGFGGSCFPKDVKALISFGKSIKARTDLMDAVIRINENQPDEIINLLKSSIGKLSNKRILVLGLAFKPETDDVRESVSIKIIEKLIDSESVVRAHDPIASSNAMKVLGPKKNFSIVDSWKEEIDSSEAVLILTKWPIYKDLLNNENQLKLKGKILFDPRHFFKKDDFPESKYISVGTRI